jgi:isoamylase
LIRLRRDHPVFRRTKYLEGRGSAGSDLPDVWWMRPDGRRMTQRDWRRGDARSIGVFLNGEEISALTPRGEPVLGESFLLLFNAHHEPIEFKLPTKRFGTRWRVEVSTADPDVEPGSRSYPARAAVVIGARAATVFRRAW